MGSISKTSGDFTGILEYSESIDTGANKSTITATLKVSSSQWGSWWGMTTSGTINIDGQIGNVSTGANLGKSSTITIGTVTKEVYHNSNGDKTINISFSISNGVPFSASNNTNWTLTHIDRYAQMTNASDNNTNESTIWFDFNNPRNLEMRSWLEINPTGQHLATRTITNPGTSGRYTYELTQEEINDLCSQLPNTNKANTFRIGIYSTLDGTTYASYQDKKFSIVNANPIFTDFEYEDINSTTLGLTGNNQKIILGYSDVKAIISTSNKAEAQLGASMSVYHYKVGDVTPINIPYSSSASVNGHIPNASSGTLEVTAYDSRGNTQTVTKTVPSSLLINYNDIYIDKTNCKVERDNNLVGENAILTFSGTFWSGNFGNVNNNLTVTYELKKTDSSTWITGTTPITPSISGNNFSFSDYIASDNLDTTWDLDASYNVRVTITDELSTSTVDLILSSSRPTLCLDKNGVGILCGYDSSKGGSLQVNGEPIDIEIYSTDETKTRKIWVDGKSIYRRVVIFTNVSYSPTPTYDVGLTPSVLDTLIDIQGTYMMASGSSSSIPRGHPSAQSWECNAYIQSNGLLTLEMGSSYSNIKAVIVLEYTKK